MQVSQEKPVTLADVLFFNSAIIGYFINGSGYFTDPTSSINTGIGYCVDRMASD